MAEYEQESGGDKSVLDQAKKHYKLCVDADTDNRIAAKDDLLFLAGGTNQWPIKAVQQRQLDGRPCLTINSLPTFVHQVTNDQRQNRPSIKVHPVDDGADVKTAKVIQGLIRHIEYESNADIAYDRAVNSAARIGFGFWYLTVEYENERSMQQRIVFRSVRNALSVRIDPLSVEPDGSDMQYAFIDNLMAREEFKRQYPEAEANNVSLISDGSMSGWLTDNTVLVTEYYCLKWTPAKLALLQDGTTAFEDELSPEQKKLVVSTRQSKRCKTMWYKLTGADVLDQTEIKCKWVPVFPVYGDEIDIEGKVIRAGIIRNAKDPAQMYNMMMTSAVEEIALRPKVPFIMAEGQEEGHEDEFVAANNRSLPYITYKPVTIDGHLAPPPQRSHPADVPTGFLAMAAQARDNIKATTGIFDASLGARGNETSGRAILARQKEGDVANFHYFDGLIRSLRQCGRCLVDMLPHYYDTTRTIRIMGEDEKVGFAVLNQPNERQEKLENGKIPAYLNDLSAGTYDVTIAAGPSYSTLRQEAAEAMAENMNRNPQLWGIVGDLYIRNQDWPGADEMAERIKKTIPPQLVEVEGDDEAEAEVINTPEGPIPVAQVPVILEGMKNQLMQMREALTQADLDKAELAKAKAAIEQQEIRIKEFDAATKRMEMERKTENDKLKEIAEIEKARADQMAAEADQLRAVADAERERANQTPRHELTDEALQALIAAKQTPRGMRITAPSGQVYSVDLEG